jgi:hypothetical protein
MAGKIMETAVWGQLRTVACFGLFWCFAGLCQAEDIQEIVRRGTAAIQSDWDADPNYAYVERDEVQKGDKTTSKTAKVVMIAGSDYYLPIAINDEPLSRAEREAELQKLKNEVARRNAESASARRERMEHYKKERDENAALLLEFPKAFVFELQGEEMKDGHLAYILSATPKKRSDSGLSRAAKVLSGMRGTLWIDKETFHPIRGVCDVVTPVPIYGILARVLPGTHISLGMAPASESTWLVSDLSMTLDVAKFFLFKSTQVTRSTYSEYRLNALVVDELLSEAGHPAIGHEGAPDSDK